MTSAPTASAPGDTGDLVQDQRHEPDQRQQGGDRSEDAVRAEGAASEITCSPVLRKGQWREGHDGDEQQDRPDGTGLGVHTVHQALMALSAR
jgi:hypothetical protein